MGAMDFENYIEADSAEEAFRELKRIAYYEYGHSGYSGTIAEKDDFVMIDVPDGDQPIDYARALMEQEDERVYDKYGPAGCVRIGKKGYLFFGIARS